jgi:Right handed beta helix region
MIMDKFPPSPRARGRLSGLLGAFTHPLGWCALVLLSCIERSNPFDPINASALVGGEIRQQNQAGLEAKTALEAVFASDLKAFKKLFSADSTINDSLAKLNTGVKSGNEATKDSNASIQRANSATPVEALRDLGRYYPLDTLRAYGPYAGFLDRKDKLQIQIANLRDFMATVNLDNRPLLVYDKSFADSVLTPFKQDSTGFERLQFRIDSGNTAVRKADTGIQLDNDDRTSENLAVKSYNDSIGFLRLSANHPIIAQMDSLLGKAKLVNAGDTLLLGPGEFKGKLTFAHSGTPNNPIVIRGFPGLRTVIKAFDPATGESSDNAVFFDGSFSSNFVFQDIVFRKGGKSAFKIVGASVGVVFRHCQFDSSGYYGLEVNDGSVNVFDSRVLANGGGGIFISGDQSKDYKVELKNTLIARNGGQGIHADSPAGDILNCTIADNGSDGIYVNSPLRRLRVRNSIVSGNLGFGFFRVQDLGPDGAFDTDESVVWGNALGGWGVQRPDSTWGPTQASNNLLDTEPKFTNSPAFDYSLVPGSPVAEYEKQALHVVIGYRP